MEKNFASRLSFLRLVSLIFFLFFYFVFFTQQVYASCITREGWIGGSNCDTIACDGSTGGQRYPASVYGVCVIEVEPRIRPLINWSLPSIDGKDINPLPDGISMIFTISF